MTILFVPGFMADNTLWDEVVAALGTEDVAFAQLDRGDSIAEMASHVLDLAQPTFDLVGFSMGGYVARAMARMAPERVKSLVLIATSARPDTPEQAERKTAAVAQLSATRRFQGLSRTSILASLHPSRVGDEALVERVRTMGQRLGRDVFLRQASLARPADHAGLAAIRCPTLVIAASDDRLRSLEEAREMRDGIANAELVEITGSGHMIPIEDPGAVARAIMDWQLRLANGR